MHKTVLVTAPTVEPVELAEAKAHLNYTNDDLDSYISSLIISVRRAIERYLRRALITQSWKVYYDCWKHELLIPFGALQTVTTVKYYDDSGTQQTLSANTYYWVVTTEDPGRIVRKYNVTYPELQYGRPDGIEIAFTAGFGAAASAVPDEIRNAIKLMLTDYFEHKGTVVIGEQVNKIPNHIADLIHSYRLYEF